MHLHHFYLFDCLFVLCCICLTYEKMKKNKMKLRLSSNFSLLGWSCTIQMMISLPITTNKGLQTQNLFPLCIFFARLVFEVVVIEVRMHVLISYLK
jgi:hypothetical protein